MSEPHLWLLLHYMLLASLLTPYYYCNFFFLYFDQSNSIKSEINFLLASKQSINHSILFVCINSIPFLYYTRSAKFPR
ncbi:hypothetical protein O3M35_007956 [Rhynocoris fuscipes]|uniref:ATP synthase F0 subunit 8 n=1 Tax=Rhynocoris fuscipes TaxID=488301 RepID=A0AAW1DGY0_9HEMI